MHPWLRLLRHDLLKRAVWPARDLRETGERDLVALQRGLGELLDAEGRRVTALELWAALRRDAPPEASRAALDAFERALSAAAASLQLPWPQPLEEILALEPAFESLARAVDSPEEP